jgi:hypothetical protein
MLKSQKDQPLDTKISLDNYKGETSSTAPKTGSLFSYTLSENGSLDCDRDETFIQSLIGTFIKKVPTEVNRDGQIATFKVGSINIRKISPYIPSLETLASISTSLLHQIKLTNIRYFITCDGELDRLTFCFGDQICPPVGTYFVEPKDEVIIDTA